MTTRTALVNRLENHYDFQCEGGPLKNCVEWIRLKDSLVALESPSLPTEEVIRLLRCVRPLDCGAHYCRYCPAKSPEWAHGPSCPYVESQKDYDDAQRMLRRLTDAPSLPTAREVPDYPTEQALRYAVALMRGRLDVEAPTNARVIREHIAALEKLAALSSQEPPK